jgi:hypothetical protein
VAADAVDGDGRAVEAACADDDSVVAGVADQHAVELRIAMQERLDAGEIARVLVGVEEDEQASTQVVADLLEIGGQVTEDRDGDLAVGGATAVQPAVADARFRGRVVPRGEIAERCRVEACVQAIRRAGADPTTSPTTATGCPVSAVSTDTATSWFLSHVATCSIIGLQESSPPRLGIATSSRVSATMDSTDGVRSWPTAPGRAVIPRCVADGGPGARRA